MTTQWYYAIDGRIQGPVSSEELRQRASRREIAATDLVWREGMTDWASAESLGLANPVSPPPLPGLPGDKDSVAEAPTLGTAADPSAAHPVTSPPLIGPPRIELTQPAAAKSATQRTTSAHNPRERHSRQSHRATGVSWAFRAAGLAIGVFAILVCGFWIGHVVGAKSIQDSESQVTVIADPNSAASRKSLGGQTATGLVDPNESNPTPHSDDGMPPDLGAPPTNRPVPRSASADADGRPTDVTPSPPVAKPLAVSGTLVPPPKPRTAATESVPAPPLPANTGPPEDQGPCVLFQTLEIERKPTFVMPGITISQELRYRIVSQLQIAACAADGSRKVVQIIERTYLDHADDLLRSVFTKSLKLLERQQYTFKLNNHNEVVEFTGLKKNKFSLPVTLPGSTGLQLTSVIDEDGWKELAQLTFFQPDDSVAQGEPYVRQLTHDFAPFGSWSGTTTFIGAEVRGDLQSIRFQHKLKFTPPEAKASASPLGFRVGFAEFTVDQADGTMEFDRKHQRVSNARETFHVRGNVVAILAGQTVNIQMQERQLMTIRVTDQRPITN